MTTAVVIGGGMSGLSAAYYLQKSAKITKLSKIIVLEASNRFGGWMQTLRDDDGAKMELGPRSIRPSGPAGFNTLCLIEDLGITRDIVKVTRSEPAAKNRFIYANGKLNVLPNSLSSIIKRQDPFSKPMISYVWRDLRTKRQMPEDESVYDFMKNRFHEDMAKYVADPMCRGIFAGDCRNLSVKSCLPPVYDAEARTGSIIKGILKPGKKQRQQRRCNLHKKAKIENWATYSFKDGLQFFSDTLRDAVKANPIIELAQNSPCDSVSFKDNKAIVTVNGQPVTADHVVSSIYASDIAKLLPDDLSGLSANLKKIPAVNCVVVGVEFTGNVQPPQAGFGHLLPSFEDPAVMGVIYDSCTFLSMIGLISRRQGLQ